MAQQRSSRKRRKERQRSARAEAPAEPGGGGAEFMERAYARGRAKDEEARAALEPLKEGERPTAVTVAAIVATLMLVANIVAIIIEYDPDEPGKTTASGLSALILLVVAVGLWRAKYWGLLGMQTVLGLTLSIAALGAIQVANWRALLLIVLIVLPCGTLFWFLVKAMARIQMPKPPGG